jgi:hypothetical protein
MQIYKHTPTQQRPSEGVLDVANKALLSLQGEVHLRKLQTLLLHSHTGERETKKEERER